jgi:hypothetical protein
MKTETVVAVVAASVSIVATASAIVSAIEARRQTRIQRQLREDAAQPFVWVDIRADEAQGTLLQLVVGNSGSTVATDVRVAFDATPPTIDQFQELIRAVETRLASGIASLMPGRTLRWPLGQGFNILKSPELRPISVSIDANGPFGAVPTQRYSISLADLGDSLDQPAGSLHQLTKAVRDLKK